MRLWRIASNVPGEYQADDLSGEGARRNGARWNSVGVPAVYASFTVSTAVLESLAHLGGRKAPHDRYLVGVNVPDRLFHHAQHGVTRFAASALKISQTSPSISWTLTGPRGTSPGTPAFALHRQALHIDASEADRIEPRVAAPRPV
jgi:hypothetical protein